MSLNLLSTSFGNLITMLVNLLILRADGTARISNVEYYLFFMLFMLITAIAFVPYAACYKERAYVQDQGRGPPRTSTINNHETELAV